MVDILYLSFILLDTGHIYIINNDINHKNLSLKGITHGSSISILT